MKIEDRIIAFETLGIYLQEFIILESGTENITAVDESILHKLKSVIDRAEIENPWFTRDNILFALGNMSDSLKRSKIEKFIQPYSENFSNRQTSQTIGVVMAGNIPVVGFHDFFCILMAGHIFLGKLSSEDSCLLPAIADILILINPAFSKLISFSKEKLSSFDAIIATGSNNTNRYFEYYFGKYPHILRKNRNSVAILTGSETVDELSGLADDIFLYFGKGCKSISKIYIPEGFNFDLLTIPFNKYQHSSNHHKYRNNYNYYKTIFIIDKVPFADLGHLLLVENSGISSPVSVLYYEYYQDILLLKEVLAGLAEQIQCVVCCDQDVIRSIRPGKAQYQQLWDYADGVDTLNFLLNL